MANAPYQTPPAELPPAIAKLSWDQWQSIRFRDDHSLWFGDGLRFRAQLFHLGFTIKKPVKIYTIENGQAQEVSYDPALFDYSRSGVDARKLAPNLGFAGFRLLFHGDWKRDFAAFQGASYFRAVDGELQYGMSQRGLAIDCGLPRPEEFPDFVAYYLERPAEGFEPDDHIWPARLTERRRRLPLHRRCGGHGTDGHRRRTVSAKEHRSAWHRARHQHVPLRSKRPAHRQ